MKLTINNQQITVTPGQSILEAAVSVGIKIPTLCHHKDLSPVGSCRLCLVEVNDWHEPVAACTQQVEEGLIVQTETPAVVEYRKEILEMLLADYTNTENSQNGEVETEFEHWVRVYKAKLPAWATGEPRYQVDSDPNPFIRVDLNQCILCTRCIRACEEVQGRFVWGVGERGRQTKIIAGADTNMLDARCESCGACSAYCPTGALTDRFFFDAETPDRLVTTTCSYCGVGCQFDLNVKDDQIIGVTSNENAPVNGISLCVKGRYGWDYIHHDDRLLMPRVRKSLLIENSLNENSIDDNEWVEVDWETALDLVANKFTSIQRESGSDAIGVFSSAKCSNEENYLIQKFARQVIGTHNVDHCARLCHSSTVAGLKMCFGSGAMSNSMDDIVEHAKAMFIIGSNTTEQHPVFGAMIRQAVLRRGLKLVVADPRKIDITEFAVQHLRQHPGTDVALLNGLMHIILNNNWHDQNFIDNRCEGFEEFRETIENYPPDVVSEITGVSTDELHQTAKLLAASRPMAVVWAMGITQHTTGVLNVLSLGNLQMLLGNMGLPGGGVNPLRGQNNVQGACDMGALPNVFPGYQSVTDNAIIYKFETAWALESADKNHLDISLTNQSGLTITEMINAAGTGEVRGLYIVGENPALTDPDSNHVRACLDAAEFVVLQDIFPSETSQYADILLPGTSFAERTGTFTNTERRVQLFQQAINPLGDARPDWQITSDIACRMIHRQQRQPTGPHADWKYSNSAEIMQEIALLTPSYHGLSHKRLEKGERLQWPVTDSDHPGTPILHVGKFTRGQGLFHAVDHLPAHELPDDDYPLLMTTGRVLYHWHGGEMTRRAHGLLEIYPESLIEISSDDATRLGIADEQSITVQSRRGETIARAVITERVSPGILFGNFHFPGTHNINNVTIAALDPIAKIPEYKVCAVRVEPMT